MLSNNNTMAEIADQVKEHNDNVCATQTAQNSEISENNDIKREHITKPKTKHVVEKPQSASCLLKSLREWNKSGVRDESKQKVLHCLSEMSEEANLTPEQNVVLELLKENDNLTMGDLSMLMTYHNQGLIAFSAENSDACLIKVKKEFHVFNTAVETANKEYAQEMEIFEKELEAMTSLSDMKLDSDCNSQSKQTD